MIEGDGWYYMEIMQVLLSLVDNNVERVKINPKTQLAPLYREILGLRQGLQAMECRLAELEKRNRDGTEETERLIQAKTAWGEEIEKLKDQLVRSRDLTLKEMLSVQQQVVQFEDSIHLADERIVELRMERKQDEQTQTELTALRKSQTVKYNQRAEIYNREKANADILMQEYGEKEDSLLAQLPPGDRMVYREALRSNPESPVASLDGDSCGGCRIGLSTQIVRTALRGEKLVYCENCMRVLVVR